MSTVAEIVAAIKKLPPQERDEVKMFLHECMVKDWNAKAESSDKPKQKPQAPPGATSL